MKRLALACALTFPLAAQAVDSITVTPIENRNLPSAQNVHSGPYNLPLITWGGDIATISANGSNAVTDSHSLFGSIGLKFKLEREDIFENQLKNYIQGKSPFLRGSMSMINMAASAVNNNSQLTPVVFYQLTWSSGGDALVVKNNIKRASDLCGKTIAINYDGPHLNYAYRILSDAGCKIKDNHFVWTRDLSGTSQTPLEALRSSKVDAAFMITPDALAASSGGNVGTGSEDSIKGAHILLSTKTANRVIADVYAVRKDYYDQHKDQIEKFVSAMTKAQQALSNHPDKNADYRKLMAASAKLLLDTPEAVTEAEALLGDATIAGANGNIAFFQDDKNFRNFEQVVKESSQGLREFGVIRAAGKVLKADINYKLLATGSSTPVKTAFDSQQVAKVVESRQKQGTLDNSTVFEFEVYFKPNQKAFDQSLYQSNFKRVVELSQTYAGAVITIEGHSDPMGYLRKKKEHESAFVLNRIKQSAKNLSMTRAQQVRQAIMDYAAQNHVQLDESQFSVIGHGISNPKTGICGVDPCAPRNEKEWLSNMRVVFRLLQVEAEESAFSPL
ncbi:OmpA family protein [Vibrio xiamenensis]|uniref:OmpA family protein n=1 Tax=Vibrio xiamenensis TaxID=861298 RepID=A0A1G8DDP1_9VIBR|nr:ABC transporter substrate-binding protein [Vibrio xiamenensis]SDH55753.1 OmpA family protein [Vibrio xiamenensis]